MGTVTCSLRIDVVAPGILREFELQAKPRDIRNLAFFLVEKCVSELHTGGFATLHLVNLVDWALNPSSFLYGMFPLDAVFITVSIMARNLDFHPGTYDPEIALALWGASNLAATFLPENSQDHRVLLARADLWRSNAHRMTRGPSERPWFMFSSSSDVDEMIYECDSNLGNPAMSDCAQIEWSQLGHPSDSLTIGPEATFLHFNTCTLAISATLTIVLLWQQIQTASAMLMDTCIQYPYLAPRGGRAYYNMASSHVDGAKSKRQSNVTGQNALPPHANVTIFEQRQGWTSASAELNSCTWKAVQAGQPVKPCDPE